MLPTQYNFTEFVLDVREKTLCRRGKSLKLKSRNFQVLQFLVENAGKIVTKEEFFQKIWNGAFIEENNLTVAVAQIRKILGETKETKFIETVPRKGYRFIADVERVFDEEKVVQTERESDENNRASREAIPANLKISGESPAVQTTAQPERSSSIAFSPRKLLPVAALALIIFSIAAFWRQSAAPSKIKTLKSIAVLPLMAENASPEQRIFAEKLTEDLTRNLARVTDLRVAAYDSLASFDSPDVDLTKIGGDLKIDGFVTGKIIDKNEKSENTDLEIKISDAVSGVLVWEKRYALNRENLAESQYRVASDIARNLGKNKEVQNPAATVGYEAYQTYLLAQHHLGKRTTKDYEKAIENFTSAAAKDASFADAYSGLATAHVLHGQNLYAARGLSASAESFPSAKQSAIRALEINPNSDEALSALAFVNYRSEYDWTTAETNFKRAVQINPNNLQAHRWYGDFLHKSGRFEEGFVVQKNALALEPNSARILNEIAWGNYLAHRFDEAVKYVEAARLLDKNNPAALYNASEIYESKKDYAAAAALWKEAMILEEANRKWIANLEKSVQTDGYRGFVRAKTEWLENLIGKDYVYPTDLAKGYAALGENDKAIAWLEKGAAARVPDMLSVRYAPAFDSLRGDARFEIIIRQMNFPL